ncbi:hypothetical protein PCK1_002575 [Pneumocystis canis]|nr:hypothetical protein PCK1_002575 [Pneumocystis canis]
MNIYLVIVLINITYVISKDNVLGFINTNFNSFDLHNRDAFKIRSLSIKSTASQYGDSSFLMLVLKESFMNSSKCEQDIQKYCQKLADMGLNPEKLNQQLKDICSNKKLRKTICEEYKKTYEDFCTSYKQEFQQLVKTLTSDQEHQSIENKCLIWNRVCQLILKEECTTIRIQNYQKRRNEVADEILIRTLVGVLKENVYQPACIVFLEEKCLKLAKMSKELAEKCINAEETYKIDNQPYLKYIHFSGTVSDIFSKDFISSFEVLSNILVLGSHNGYLYIIDMDSDRLSQHCIHSASVSDVSIDNTGEYIATASIDGSVALFARSSNNIILYNYRRPVKSVAIDPNYSQNPRIISGGMAEQLIMNEKGIF